MAATPWVLPFALIASVRFLEVAIWYLKLLFDPTHEKLYSAERNLLFLLGDSVSVVIITGLWLATGTSQPSEAAPIWSAAISTFTLNGVPTGYNGWSANVATALGSFGGLVLIGAGLASSE